MVRVQLTVDGVELVNRNLERFTKRIADASPAFEEIADMFATAEARQFETEGAFGGTGAWSPLSPRYAKWKIKHFPGTKILHRTGRLERSLSKRPFGLEQIGPKVMTIGTAVPYAKYHQHGGGHLPTRPPIGLSKTTRRSITKIVQRFIQTGEVHS